MKFEFPDTGEGVTEGEFLQWLVDEGEEVEEDQAVAEAETDKAVIDIPAPADGTIESLKADPGDTVKVGDVILEMNTGNDSEDSVDHETEEDTGNAEEKTVEPSQKEYSGDSVLALPKTRKLAREEGVDLDSLDVEGRITDENVLDASEASRSTDEEKSSDSAADQVMATPSVRKLAREEEIDIQEVEGTGRGGKVTRDDVLNFSEPDTNAEEVQEAETDKNRTSSVPQDEDVERVPMSNLRKTVASRMEKSRFTAPHVTHVEKADVTELSELRERVNETSDQHLTYLPFVTKAVVDALEKHPDLNAELDEENDEIVRYRSFDFNIAVDTENGLMSPLVKNTGEKSIIEIAETIVDVAEKAKNSELSRDELENGTFTLTNLGAIGGEEFTPIINHPQVAILGIGSIEETAEVVEGEITPRTTVKLSLSYDHRVVDGADAARFMNRVVENLEKPESLLVKL